MWTVIHFALYTSVTILNVIVDSESRHLKEMLEQMTQQLFSIVTYCLCVCNCAVRKFSLRQSLISKWELSYIKTISVSVKHWVNKENVLSPLSCFRRWAFSLWFLASSTCTSVWSTVRRTRVCLWRTPESLSVSLLSWLESPWYLLSEPSETAASSQFPKPTSMS